MDKIRDFEETDNERVTIIMQEATADLRKVYRPLGALKQDKYVTEGWRKIVFETHGLVIGVVEVTLNGKSAFIQGLAVDREYRKQGVARKLIGVCEDRSRSKGATLLRLLTIKETGNPEIFRRLGFLISSEKISERFIGSDERPVFQIELQKPIKTAQDQYHADT